MRPFVDVIEAAERSRDGGTTVGNPIIHVEVVGKNAKGLQQFFGDLFGWELDTNYPNDYAIAEKAGGGGADFGAGPSPDGGYCPSPDRGTLFNAVS